MFLVSGVETKKYILIRTGYMDCGSHGLKMELCDKTNCGGEALPDFLSPIFVSSVTLFRKETNFLCHLHFESGT